jgi:23S rRNA (adenine2503-C2)-methyltransferase
LKRDAALGEVVSLYNFTRHELKEHLASLGAPPYAGNQVFIWLYRKRARSVTEMTDLPADFRSRLSTQAVLQPLKLADKRSSSDGTLKYVWEASAEGDAPGPRVESVLIPMQLDEDGEPGRYTACLSTQAGCRMKCSFCATGVPRFQRQLTAAEIVGQFLGMEIDSGKVFHNVVVMGMGEPLDNYENCERAMRILNDSEGLNLGRRRITLSTSGLLEPLKRFTKDDWPVSLALSLHSAIPEKRDALMPVNRAHPLDPLRKLLRDYTFVRRLPVTLEILLIKGVNDGPEDADALVSYAQGLLCKVNLIRYNSVPGLSYEEPDDETVRAFQGRLKAAGVRAFLRERKGSDIAASCGQLGGLPVLPAEAFSEGRST